MLGIQCEYLWIISCDFLPYIIQYLNNKESLQIVSQRYRNSTNPMQSRNPSQYFSIGFAGDSWWKPHHHSLWNSWNCINMDTPQTSVFIIPLDGYDWLNLNWWFLVNTHERWINSPALVKYQYQ